MIGSARHAFFYWAAAAVLLLGCAYARRCAFADPGALSDGTPSSPSTCAGRRLAPHAAPFWAAFVVLGGASAASLGRAAASLAEIPRHGAALAAIAVALPLLFALYCRRAFFP